MQKGASQELKMITCTKGKILDIYIDCRIEKSSFKEINSVILEENVPNTLIVPRGCLHAFLTLEDNCEVLYLTDNYYDPSSEVTVNPFSPETLNVINKYKISNVSDKDKNSQLLEEYFSQLQN